MATVKERVSYICSYLKGLGAPSETAIAMLCNIRAESGANFNPQAIEIGSGAPPFTASAQGFGLFQFSNYPTNQNMYVKCKDMSDKKAIETQIDKMIDTAKNGSWFTNPAYPSFNLTFNEWLKNTRNWSASQLTFAFMREWERPYDMSQDRYKLFVNEIKALYDFSKYDSNGNQNTNTDSEQGLTGYDYPPFAFDCGGKPISTPDDDSNPSQPPTPSTDNGIPKDILTAIDRIAYRYDNSLSGWKNGSGYQCVALIQSYLDSGHISHYNNKANAGKGLGFGFKDGMLPSAWAYGTTLRAGLNAGNTVMGLSPKKWQVVTKNFKKGDILFYSGGSYGHVAIASSSNNRFEQNVTPPYNGGDSKIRKNPIASPNFAIRKFG